MGGVLVPQPSLAIVGLLAIGAGLLFWRRARSLLDRVRSVSLVVCGLLVVGVAILGPSDGR